jgi:hypothetical protein
MFRVALFATQKAPFARLAPLARTVFTKKEVIKIVSKELPTSTLVKQAGIQVTSNVLRALDPIIGRPATAAIIKIGMKVTQPLWQNLFYAGPTLQNMQTVANWYRTHGIGIIVQGARESSHSHEECIQAKTEYLSAILQADTTDYIAVKPTALILTDAIKKMTAEQSMDKDNPQLSQAVEVVKAASQKGVKILWDAEGADIQDTINQIGWMLQKVANQAFPCVHNTYQIHKGNEPVETGKKLAESGNYSHAGKYVKGAYDYRLPNVQSSFDAYHVWVGSMPNTSKDASFFGTHNPDHIKVLVSRDIPFGNLMGFSTDLTFQYKELSHVAVFYGDKKSANLFFERRAEEVLDMHPKRAKTQYEFWTSVLQKKS